VIPAAARFEPAEDESEFKRHIEARGTGFHSIEFDARQIAKRILAGLHQVENPVEPTGAAWNLESRSRILAESG
jgi:hypothetical protein